ncbi:very-long-chain aldehyde decarbonylase CER3 isoform X3 [Cryptomeria japonica]|nr:very-long-chain aldehyde decarbonylase CER3 isoform X3 [Cryptomeria japonica]
MGHKWVPGLVGMLPMWNSRGILTVLLLHMGPTELLYYFSHRAFHKGYLFQNYHYLHHESTRPEPSTSGTSSFLEQLVMVTLMSIPIGAAAAMGEACIGMFYVYFLGFDFLKFMQHSNVEVVPLWLFNMFPFLKYLISTPSYHSIHHTKLDCNYCLFMPLYDYLGGTANIKETSVLHSKLRTQGQEWRIPNTVFLCHAVHYIHTLHLPYFGRTFAARPCTYAAWYLWIYLPLIWIGFTITSPLVPAHTISKYHINEKFNVETWGLPRLGFQFFLPFGQKQINKLIEDAILEADRLGVKVFALGALTKNEVLNGGGELFVRRNPNLSIRVAHGNTLTASVLLHELPENVEEVFLSGSTSKIGKAIALYLCRKRVRVLMLTASLERFKLVKNEAPAEYRNYLIHSSTYEAGSRCKTWIVGKWAGYRDQKCAPKGTQFYQFTLPKIVEFRSDCTYRDSVSLVLPQEVKGLNCCEYTMPRRVVHACHAGGVVHALEGYKNHEVGAINVDHIDLVWNAAIKYGFTLVPQPPAK